LAQHWKTLPIGLREYWNSAGKTLPITIGLKEYWNSTAKTALISLRKFCNNAGKTFPMTNTWSQTPIICLGGLGGSPPDIK